MGISKPDWSTGSKEQHLLSSVLESSIEHSCASRNVMTYPHSPSPGLKTHHAAVLQPGAGKCPLPRVQQHWQQRGGSIHGLSCYRGHRKPEAKHSTASPWAHPKQWCWDGSQMGRKQLWNMQSCKSPGNQWESGHWLCREQQQDPAMAWNYN